MPGKEFGSFCIFTNKESLFVHLSINIWLPWLPGFPPLSFSGAYPPLASQITLTKTCQLVLSTSKGNSRYAKAVTSTSCHNFSYRLTLSVLESLSYTLSLHTNFKMEYKRKTSFYQNSVFL